MHASPGAKGSRGGVVCLPSGMHSQGGAARSVTLRRIGLLLRFKDSSQRCEVVAVGCEELFKGEECVQCPISVKCLHRLGVLFRKGCLLLLVSWFLLALLI